MTSLYTLFGVFLNITKTVRTTHQNAKKITKDMRTVHIRANSRKLDHDVLDEQIDQHTKGFERLLVRTLLQSSRFLLDRLREILVCNRQGSLHNV